MTNQWKDFDITPVFGPWSDRTRDSMEQGLRDTAPVGKGITSGRFANSIEAVVQAGGLEIDGEGEKVPGVFLMTGTQAHVIEPRQARVLRWEDSGGEHFAMHVQHPGTQPSDFVDRTIDAHQEEWESDVLDSMSALWAQGS